MLCLSSVKGVRSGGELKGPEKKPPWTVQEKPYQGQTIHICCNVTAESIVKMWESESTKRYSLLHRTCCKPNNAAYCKSLVVVAWNDWIVPQNQWPRTRPGRLCDAVWYPRLSMKQEVSWKEPGNESIGMSRFSGHALPLSWEISCALWLTCGACVFSPQDLDLDDDYK